MLRFLGALTGTLAGLIVGIPNCGGRIVRLHERDHQRAGDSRYWGCPRTWSSKAVAARTTAGLPRAAFSPHHHHRLRRQTVVLRRSSGARRGVAPSPQRAIRVVHNQRTLQGFGGPAFSLDTRSFNPAAPGGSSITRGRVRLSQWPDAEADRDGVWARQGCIGGAPHKARAHRITTPLRSRCGPCWAAKRASRMSVSSLA